MKLSFITDEATQDFETALAFAGKYGFDGVELRSVGDAPIDRIPADTLRGYRRRLDEEGLVCCNLASSFFKCAPDDEAARAAELEKLDRLCDAADILGCSSIRGFAFFAAGPPEDRLEEISDRFREPDARLARRGKTLLLEADPSVYTTNHRRLAALLARIASPRIGAVYDPGNDLYDPEHEIPFPDGYRAVAPYIRHVHVKDAVQTPDGPVCVKVGTGAVDYPGILRALAADGYGGFCSLETHYRKNARISEELMRMPRGAAFSAGGLGAAAESAESFRALVRRYARPLSDKNKPE